MSWLLPFGLFGAILLAFRSRLRRPLASGHNAAGGIQIALYECDG